MRCSSSFCVATGMSTTIGYHRLFAHGTFKACARRALLAAAVRRGDVRGVGAEVVFAAPAAPSLHRHRARSLRRQQGILARPHRLDPVLAPPHQLRQRQGPAQITPGGSSARSPCMVVRRRRHCPADAHRLVDRASAGRIRHGGLPAHRHRPAFDVLRELLRPHVRNQALRTRRSRRATTGSARCSPTARASTIFTTASRWITATASAGTTGIRRSGASSSCPRSVSRGI